MLVAKSVVLNVETTESVLANFSDNSSYPRALYFRNQHASASVELKVQSSLDGGITWVDISPTPYILGAGEVLSMWVEGVGAMLRVKGSTNGSNVSVYFGIARFMIPSFGQPTGLNLSLYQ